MSDRLPHLARAILHTLLDRHEQPERQTVVRVRLSEHTHPDYFSPTDATPRQATNTALQHLASQGMLHLHWQKWEQGNWLEAVDLLPDHADALYTLLQRTPRPHQEHALHTLLQSQSPQADWHATFLAWAAQQLDQHRSVAPLTLDDAQWNVDMLTALAAIAQLQAPTSERTLSVRLFASSKRLADLRNPIVAVLRRFAPQAAQFGDDDRALLQAHMLQRIPEYVPVAGPLVVQYAEAGQPAVLIDLRGVAQGVALPTSVMQVCQVHTCTARAIVTVENATSFHELLAPCPPALLALYIGGFASPATLALLRTVCTAQPGIVLYHWGDLDPGGLRILAHLRSNLGDVRPLAMDRATFEQHRQHAQPLSKRDTAVLKNLRQHPLLVDCQPLIGHLLATGSKLEQEAIAPPVESIRLSSWRD
jgi:hypothetical protein